MKSTHKDGTDFDRELRSDATDFDGSMMAGTMSGSGGIVMDNTVDMVEGGNINAFYAHESAANALLP